MRVLALRGVTRYPSSRGKRGGPGVPTAFAELVSRVTDARGLGMIGAPTVNADAFFAALDRVRTKTDAPVGGRLLWRGSFDVNRDAEAVVVAVDRAALVEFVLS